MDIFGKMRNEACKRTGLLTGEIRVNQGQSSLIKVAKLFGTTDQSGEA
jgi:hypothetical protein